MQFISWQFIIFFVVAMFFLLPKFKNKKGFLFILNMVFYLCSGISGFIVIMIFTAITYLFGILLAKHKKRLLFTAIMIVSLLPLAFFKYTDFIIADCLHISDGILHNFNIPLGISFITFQGLGYLIDVYRDRCKPEKNAINYFVFMSLFTCVSSGPINRSEHILSQVKNYNKTSFDYGRCVDGFRYVLLGILLKVLIAGRMSQMVTLPFSNPADSTGLALLIASICFTIQIFCDFCGYSYMAFGLSKVVGIDVIQNFEKPYFSKSITEFWRRWHISLSSWLRDYIYIPLGGSRCSKPKTYINLLITFTVSGIWHGAAWTYIAWGLLNGIFCCVEKLTGYARESKSKVIGFFKWIITMILVNSMWILFRANKISDVFIIFKKILFETIYDIKNILSLSGLLNFSTTLGVTASEIIAVALSAIIFVVFEQFADKKDNPIEIFNHSILVRWAEYMLIIFLVLILGVTGQAGDFIYAKF